MGQLQAFLDQATENAYEDDDVLVVLVAIFITCFGAHVSFTVREHHFQLCRGDLPSSQIKAAEPSAWLILLSRGSEKAFSIVTGLDFPTFDSVAKTFCPAWELRTISREDVNGNGQKRLKRRSLRGIDVLGLLLHYLTSKCSLAVLCMLFGIVPSVCSRYIRNGLALLLKCLKTDSTARISWPDDNDKKAYSQMVEDRHPKLRGGFGFVDGLNISVPCSGDFYEQNNNYNGWLCSHFVSNIFVFSPLGEIIFCTLNCPGSWHDSTVATDLYGKLIRSTGNGFFLIADSAFPSKNDVADKIKCTAKVQRRQRHLSDEDFNEFFAFNRQLTSARQAAEWGMRGIKGSFSRLNDQLPYEKDLRLLILNVIVRLYQLRVRLMNVSQIRKVYNNENNIDDIVLGEYECEDNIRAVYGNVF